MKQLPAADATTRQRLLREANNIAYTDTTAGDAGRDGPAAPPAGAQEKAR